MKKIITAMLAATMVLSTAVVAHAQEDEVTVKIFHTNDIHSRAVEASDDDGLSRLGYARYKTFIDSQSADEKIVVDAGDAFHGQPIATLEEGASIAQLMKAVGIEYLVPGNHDFNYGILRLQGLAYLADVELLGANVMMEGANSYPFHRYRVEYIDGAKVGIMGILTPETAYKTNPLNVEGLEFFDGQAAYDATQEVVDILEKMDCDVIVAVAHVGIDDASTLKSTNIAENVDGIDIIIDGHSHSLFSDNYMVNDTYITSCGEYFENVGMVTINIKEDGEVTIDPEVYTANDLKSYAPDARVTKVLEDIQERQDGILEAVIGTTDVLLDGERTSVRYGHTNLGNMITSAMLLESGADIAFTNGGGIRASIDAGDISKEEVLTVLPFGNYIVTKEIKGSDIIAALEHGMVVGEGSFPHFDGMTVVANTVTVNNADGTTATKGDVVSVTIGGEPLQADKTYILATNDFMAAGGDGYTMFTNGPVVNEFLGLDEALINYIATADEAQKSADMAEVRLILN